MWENFHIVGALIPTMREYSHIVFPSHTMRNPNMSYKSFHSEGVLIHVVKALTGRLTMYGKSLFYILFCSDGSVMGHLMTA